MSERKELSAEEKAAHRRLAEMWRNKKDSLGLDQYTFARKYATNQTSVNLYLKGKRPLNHKFCMMFSAELGVSPSDIYPELYAMPHPSGDESEFMRLYGLCTPEQRGAVIQIMYAMTGEAKK